MRVLVLGASGLLGRAMTAILARSRDLEVRATVRTPARAAEFAATAGVGVSIVPDAGDDAALTALFASVRPEVVINCIAPSREALAAGDALQIIPLCALLPHQLAKRSAESGARLIHISSDGVFSGRRGGYTEDDPPDAADLYGVAKFLGEIRQPNAVTIRTSMIGHELPGRQGLLEWFLRQDGTCTCYRRAIFSGLPAIILAEIVRDVIIPRPGLAGLFHVASEPITKCDLLRLIAQVYGRTIELIPNDAVVSDRSLDARRFHEATGYTAPDWPAMIRAMHSHWQNGTALV